MSPQILPSPAIDPDVLPSCLHGGWTLQVLDKGMRAFIERQPIVCEYMRVSTLHRSRLPAPDVVQLEEDARLHLKINFWFCFWEIFGPGCSVVKMSWEKEKMNLVSNVSKGKGPTRAEFIFVTKFLKTNHIDLLIYWLMNIDSNA